MRNILDPKKEIMDYIKLTWYFEKWYEKLILVILSALGFYTILLFLWRLL